MANTRSIRSYNTALVLRELHRKGACSRVQLAHITKLSPATVSRIVSELLATGVVYEERLGESTGGRKPVILRLDHDKLFVVGVQVHRSLVAIAIADLNGTLLHKRVYQPWALDPQLLLAEVAHNIQGLLKEACIDREEQLLGVGVAISGIVDSEHGVMVQSINLGWRNVPIGEILASRLHLPVFVENDANAGALAEMWFGGARGVGSFLYLLTEAGVGSGLVLNHRLVTGSRGMAGEIGHIPVMPNGHRCRCGQRGCLETYVYLSDVFARYKERSGRSIDKPTFFDTEKNRDRIVGQLAREAEAALALAITFPVALLDLDAVIIGGVWGESEAARERIQAACRGCLERMGIRKQVQVLGSGLGQESDLLGAVGLVIDRCFSLPKALDQPGLEFAARST